MHNTNATPAVCISVRTVYPILFGQPSVHGPNVQPFCVFGSSRHGCSGLGNCEYAALANTVGAVGSHSSAESEGGCVGSWAGRCADTGLGENCRHDVDGLDQRGRSADTLAARADKPIISGILVACQRSWYVMRGLIFFKPRTPPFIYQFCVFKPRTPPFIYNGGVRGLKNT